MEQRDEILQIITSLTQAVHPFTGEPLELTSVYRDGRILAALAEAAKALEFRDIAVQRRAALPTKAGKPWSQEEERALIEEFERGMTVPEIAALHQRSRSGIVSRLVRLGRLDASTPGNRETIIQPLEQV